MDYKKLIFVFIFPVFYTVSCEDENRKCVRENPCLCNIKHGRKIDISGLLDKPDEFLEDTDIKNNITYYFHGCTDKELLYNKTNYVGSLIKANFTNFPNKTFEVLGKSTDIFYEPFTDKGSGYKIVYRNGSNVTATVSLICDQFTTPFIKIITIVENQLVLSSPKVCIITEPPGMSGISIFFLLLLIFTIIYFVGGAFLMYFMRGARGIEMIPNVDFWRSLPTRLKNGLIYVLSGCRPTYINTEETYDRI